MKDKVFISSAQKELESERLALPALLTTDPCLLDLSGLVQKGLLVQECKGRATRYRLAAVGK